jgi:NAD-dependent DNA ligase
MHPDHSDYARFTTRSRLEKSLNSLLGIVEGIAIDGHIVDAEVQFLNTWLADHRDVHRLHPFNELMPIVAAAIADGRLSDEEREDIRWLCERLKSESYSGRITADLQRLHAILGGLVADGEITENELKGLSSWLQDHDHLKRCWPYDEIDSVITSVMADQQIDHQEQRILMAFFSEFIEVHDEKTIVAPSFLEDGVLKGVCAACPEIEFREASFCFTGASTRYTRAILEEVVLRLGGRVVPSVTSKLDYLIVGAEGNPCWAYACYGRKVEKAVELRKSGLKLVIVHENDFHDAVADRG